MEDGAEVRASAPLLVEHSPLLDLLTCTVLRQAAERGAGGTSAPSASPLGSSSAPPAAADSAPTAAPAASARQASVLGPKWVAGQPVVLRVELATRIQAKAMQVGPAGARPLVLIAIVCRASRCLGCAAWHLGGILAALTQAVCLLGPGLP